MEIADLMNSLLKAKVRLEEAKVIRDAGERMVRDADSEVKVISRSIIELVDHHTFMWNEKIYCNYLGEDIRELNFKKIGD